MRSGISVVKSTSVVLLFAHHYSPEMLLRLPPPMLLLNSRSEKKIKLKFPPVIYIVMLAFQSTDWLEAMKRCSTCDRTFEDTFTFCLIDGAVLSAPFDPQAKLVLPEPRKTEPPTEVLPAIDESKQEIPPTVASPHPQHEQQDLVSTTAAQTQQLAPSRPTLIQSTQKVNRLPLILGGAVALLVIGVSVFIVAAWALSTTENSGSKTATTNAAPNKNQAGAANADNKPSPSPSSVINLAGTTWRNEYGGIYKFTKDGKFVTPDPDILCNWTQQQEKVSMRCKPGKNFVGSNDYGTIKGDRIEGYSVHDNGERGNWIFYRQK
jgi:hypothetical protein